MEEERASLFDSVTSSATVSSVDAVGAQFADARPPADGSSVLPVPTSDGSTSSSVRLGEQTVRRRDSLPTLPPTDELAWMDEIDQEPDTPETSTRGLGWLGRKARYRASSNEEKKVVQLRPARRSSLLEALRNALGGKDNVVEPFDKEGADGGSSVASTPPRSQGMTPSRQQAEAARARATAEIERDKLFIAGKVRFVINPRAPFMGWWHALMFVLLAYTAVFAPFEVAFFDVSMGPLFVLNRMVDLCFITNVLIHLRLMYVIDRSGRRVTNRRAIVNGYARTWLVTDVIALLPCDTVALLLSSNHEDQGGVYERTIFVLNALRLLRLARLLQMGEVIRTISTSPVVVNIQDRLVLDYGLLQILSVFMYTLLLCHWIACAWRWLPTVLSEELDWLASYEELGTRSHHQDSLSNFEVYVASVYWSVLTLAAVGYGDIVPTNDHERLFTVFVMLAGAYYFGYVVGSITSIVAARNVRNTELYAYMDQLNEFMLQHALPRKLQKRLREFFRNRIAGPQSMQDYGSLWSKMTPSLRTEVVMLTSANLLLQHRVFCMCPPDFTAAVAMAMQSEFFAGRELIVTRKDYPTKMHVVTRGLATSEGRMYASGMLLGVDMLFAMFLARHEGTRRKYQAVALTYLEALTLQQSALPALLQQHPLSMRTLRTGVLAEAFRMEILAYTRALRRVNEHEPSCMFFFRGDTLGREIHHYEKLKLLRVNDKGSRVFLENAVRIIQRRWRAWVAERRAAASQANSVVSMSGLNAYEDLESSDDDTVSLASRRLSENVSFRVASRSRRGSESRVARPVMRLSGQDGVGESYLIEDEESVRSLKSSKSNMVHKAELRRAHQVRRQSANLIEVLTAKANAQSSSAQQHQDWLQEHLPQMVDRAVERHMDNLMSKLEQRLRCMLPEPAAVVASDASAAAAAATPQLKTMSPSRVPPALANHPMPAPLWDEPSTPVSGVRLESGLMAEMTLSHQTAGWAATGWAEESVAPYEGVGKPPLPKARSSRELSPEQPSAVREPLQPPGGAGDAEGGACSSLRPPPPPPGIGSRLSTLEQQSASRGVQEQRSQVANRAARSRRFTDDSHDTEGSQANSFREDLQSTTDSSEPDRELILKLSLQSTTDSQADPAPEATVDAIEETGLGAGDDSR